jgi:hypothetical protein
MQRGKESDEEGEDAENHE